MTVSIITVSFNSQSTIEQTILSVLEQSYQNIQYIVVDGASTDGTQNILQQYRHKIDVVVSEKDNGIYDAMNKGISLATGDVIGILNSDDIYADTNVIQNVVNKLTQTNAQALYADLVYVDRNDTTKIKRYWRSGAFKRSKFKWGWMPPHPTVFIQKELYTKFGTFNLSLKSAADYELMLRFFFKQNIVPVYLPKVITKMRVGGESNATVKNRVNANQEDRKAWKINELKPYWLTLYFKPLRKIPQFIFRKPSN